MVNTFEHLNKAERDEMLADYIEAGCQYVHYGESMRLIPSPVTLDGPNGEVTLIHVKLLDPEPGLPHEAYVIFEQLIMNSELKIN